MTRLALSLAIAAALAPRLGFAQTPLTARGAPAQTTSSSAQTLTSEAAESGAPSGPAESTAPSDPTGSPTSNEPAKASDPALATEANHEVILRYDSGRDASARVYLDAEPCREKPCVVTELGAVRFDLPADRYEVSLWLMHRNLLTRIEYLEHRELRDYQALERVFNRRRNKRVFSLTERIANNRLPVLFLYGITLQYEVDQGDTMIIEMSERGQASATRRYYFRYHQAGMHPAFDIALLLPLNFINYPRPGPDFENRSLNAAVTLAFKWNKDPSADYGWLSKLALSVYPSMFLGLMTRRFLVDGLSRAQADVFAGTGLTFLDFLFAGYGINVFHSPRTGGPFIGFHVGKALNFIRDLQRSSPERWDAFLDEERHKQVSLGPPS